MALIFKVVSMSSERIFQLSLTSPLPNVVKKISEQKQKVGFHIPVSDTNYLAARKYVSASAAAPLQKIGQVACAHMFSGLVSPISSPSGVSGLAK